MSGTQRPLIAIQLRWMGHRSHAGFSRKIGRTEVSGMTEIRFLTPSSSSGLCPTRPIPAHRGKTAMSGAQTVWMITPKAVF